jgi:glycosyltransferase involved in cell wall biosynthesis
VKLKILISNDGMHAMYFIRLGYARVLASLGHEVVMWDISKKPTNDAFDEFEPHIFIGQTYNVDRVLYRAIADRPHLKVVMKASDWGNFPIDLKKYPVLVARDDEKEMILRLREECGKPNYLEIHYHENVVPQTHSEWIKNGIPTVSQLSAADIFEFRNGKFDERFRSDLTFIGGYWPYKAQVLDKYLLPLCKTSLNVKIFGNAVWPVPQYCGLIGEKYTAAALASAKICPNLHEPHSQVYGYDIIERPFKLLSNKCFVVSDYVEGLVDILPEGIIYAASPEAFKEKIFQYLEDERARKACAEIGYNAVMAGHTYFHRVADMLGRLGLEDEAYECMEKYKGISK